MRSEFTAHNDLHRASLARGGWQVGRHALADVKPAHVARPSLLARLLAVFGF